MPSERGQATVEWLATMLLVGALLAVGAGVLVDASWLPRTLQCALLARCPGQDGELHTVYGPELAALVREHAPGIVFERGEPAQPVDFRSCRQLACALAGAPEPEAPVVFTHVVDRRAGGGSMYIQYWFYFPDSTYSPAARGLARSVEDARLGGTLAGRVVDAIAGHHEDDWEGFQLRVSPNGAVHVRATAHHGYAGRKQVVNVNEAPDFEVPVAGLRIRPPRSGAWTRSTGWTRVSRGSHAGHIVDDPGGERSIAARDLALVPIEGLADAERAVTFAITPPWRKPVYTDPESPRT